MFGLLSQKKKKRKTSLDNVINQRPRGTMEPSYRVEQRLKSQQSRAGEEKERKQPYLRQVFKPHIIQIGVSRAPQRPRLIHRYLNALLSFFPHKVCCTH